MIDIDAQNEWIDSLKEKLSEIEELIEEAAKNDWIGIKQTDLNSIKKDVRYIDGMLDRYHPDEYDKGDFLYHEQKEFESERGRA